MTKRPRSSQEHPTKMPLASAVGTAVEAGAWVPDPMHLAQLAAQMSLGGGKPRNPREELQKAWAFFADSTAFCMELRQMSPRKLRELYGNIPGIAHSGMVLKMIEQSGPPQETRRLYPWRETTDAARDFFGVKTARTVLNNIKEYCLAHQEEENGCPYDGILKESVHCDHEGEEYFELPLDFLVKIKEFKHERKVNGGQRKSHSARTPPRCERLRDDPTDEDGINSATVDGA